MKSYAKRMTLAAAAAAMLCAGPVFAQAGTSPSTQTAPDAPPPPPSPDGGGPRRGGPERRVEMLQQALNLTPDQTAQVKTLFAAERAKMEALRSNSAAAPEDRRSQMMAIRQDSDTKIRALLTPDQVTKYDAMQARMRERRRDGEPPQGSQPPSPPPPPPGL